MSIKRAIGLEVANSSIKVKSLGKNIYCLNTIEKIESNDTNQLLDLNNYDVFKYNNIEYAIGLQTSNGSGSKSIDRYKSEEFKIAALYGLHQAVVNNGEKLKVITGVPASEASSKHIRDLIKNSLKGHHITTYKNKRKIFEVESVEVIPQPAGCLFNELYDLRGYEKNIDRNKNYLIIDIGWCSSDVIDIHFISGVNKQDTIFTAMSDYNSWILKEIEKEYPESEIRQFIETLYDLDKRIMNTDLLETSNGTFNIKEIKNKAKKKLANEIVLKLGNFGYKLSQYHKIFLTGGGSVHLENNIKNLMPNYKHKIELVKDPVMSNCTGFYIYARKHYQV